MRDPNYWKRYLVETDAEDMDANLKATGFGSGGEALELIRFEKGKGHPSILVSPGSGGHAYVFGELAYRMHARGYNVFIMPKHGGRTITDLVHRHEDALRSIARICNDRIGIFAEGLGGYASFYVALAHGPVRSIVRQNSPAILNEREFHDAMLQGKGSARRRRAILPLARILATVLPGLRLPISVYLDFRELGDSKEDNRRIEARIVEAYLRDPHFDRSYPLSAIVSLVLTPPTRSLAELETPTMFLVPVRGFVPSYGKGLLERLPPITKRLVEVDGGVFWMVSHPREAADVICDWFDETL